MATWRKKIYGKVGGIKELSHCVSHHLGFHIKLFFYYLLSLLLVWRCGVAFTSGYSYGKAKRLHWSLPFSWSNQQKITCHPSSLPSPKLPKNDDVTTAETALSQSHQRVKSERASGSEGGRRWGWWRWMVRRAGCWAIDPPPPHQSGSIYRTNHVPRWLMCG